MDPGDDIGLRQHQNVIVTLEIAPVRTETVTPEGTLIQPVLLDHGAHGTIEQYDAFLQQALQTLDALAPPGLVRWSDAKGHRSRAWVRCIQRTGGRWRATQDRR